MKKYFILLVSIIAIFGCEKTDKKLKIGVIKPSTDYLPVAFAYERGLLDKEHFELIYFNSGWETNEALVTGNVDIAILPFTYIWTDVSKGKDVKIISFFERESDGIIAQQNITNKHELNNKKIGVLKASTLDVFANMFEVKENINMEKVYFRTPMDLAAAFNSKEVDALSYYVPSIFKFENDKNIIHWYGDDYPLHPCCDIASNDISLGSKDNLIREFYTVLQSVLVKMQIDNEEIVRFASRYYSISEDLVKKTLEHQKFKMGLDETGMTFQKDAVKKMMEIGYIEKEVSAKNVYKAIEN